MVVDLYLYLCKNYITYDSLFALNKRAFYERSDANEVNIFIDMHSLISDIFTRDFNFIYKDSNVITSSIINLCAHLRNYYYTRHRVWAKFYIVFAWNKPLYLRELFPEYNAHKIMAEETKNVELTLINENCNTLTTLCPYLPNIHFIYGGDYETTVVIGSLIRNIGKEGIPNIIYTRDSYEYLAVCNLPLTFIFRPKKSNKIDTSYLVTKTNLIDSYIENELKQVKTNLISEYSKFPIYLSYAGIKSRELHGVLQFKNALNQISNNKPFFFTVEELDRVNKLAQVADLPYNMTMFQNSNEYLEIPKALLDFYNPEEVKTINNIYFTSYPLDLNAL